LITIIVLIFADISYAQQQRFLGEPIGPHSMYMREPYLTGQIPQVKQVPRFNYLQPYYYFTPPKQKPFYYYQPPRVRYYYYFGGDGFYGYYYIN